MATTQYYTTTSIDGFIADHDNSLSWLFEVPAGDDDVGQEDRFNRFFPEVGAMAMGATTYAWVVDHDDLLEHPEKWREYYADTPCLVFSNRDLPLIPGADVRFVRGNVAPVHRDMMEAASGSNVWIVGGGDLVGQFADAGLLDEILLNIAR